MALLFSEGFDKYAAVADLALRFVLVASNAFSSVGGITAGGALSLSNNGSAALVPALGTAFSGVITAGNGVHWAGWVKFTTLNSAAFNRFLAFSTNIQAYNGSPFGISIANTGALRALRHGDSATLADSAAAVIILNQYHHIEIAAKLNTNANGGYVKVWVDRVLVINFAGDSNTGTVPTTLINAQMQTNSGNAIALTTDDWVIWDESGTDFVPAQLGVNYAHVIETLTPDADDTVQFTPLSSTNVSNIDDVGFHDGDTTYNQSTTVGHVDLFTLANQAATPQETYALVVHTRAKKTDVGGVTMRSRLKAGATTQESADFTLTTNYVHYQQPLGKNPDTGPATWGTSDVDSVKVGYEYQA